MTASLAEPVRTTPTATPSGTLARPRSSRPDRRRWRDGPTPASLADLVALTRDVADDVASGLHPVHVDPAHRWSQRLHADVHLDVWLISWATEQAAELHDHGGSLGALTVVRGALTEWRWTAGPEDDGSEFAGGSRGADRRAGSGHGHTAEELVSRGPGLRRRVLDPGRGVAFGLGHVHDVSNRAAQPAVSVHAYSPPLSAMSFYAVDGGVLHRSRSELVAPGQAPG